MKIISWNVNGLRSLIQKVGTSALIAFDADILCLQETKLSSSQFKIDVPDYYQFYSSAERRGYAGTAILTRIKPTSVVTGLDGFDTEGRVITAEYDHFYLVCAYVPTIGADRSRFREEWDDEFRKYVSGLNQTKPVIICGDFNTAHHNLDVFSPSSFTGTPGFTPEERFRFTELIKSGFVDVFRIFHPNTTGAFTWWSYRANSRIRNAGMRLDYFLASDRLSDRLISCDILNGYTGSDHCPIELNIKNELIPSESVLPNNSGIAQSPAPLTLNGAVIGFRFKRYDYHFDDTRGRRITRSFILLERKDGMIWFTDFHKYIRNPRSVSNNISQHGVSRFDFLIPLLNHAYFQCGINRFEDITIEIIQKYLTVYATGQAGCKKNAPQKETVERCVDYVFDFIDLALMDSNNHFSFSREDLYREVVKRNKRGNVYTEKVPVFEVPRVSVPKEPLNRDIPEKAFFLLLDYIVRHHTDVLGLVMAGAFVGCRPGEETNIRCENSPLGPGIIFTIINGEVVKIAIDLTMERTLRSDNVIVGSIKKERTQYVPNLFIQPFMTCYRIYDVFMASNRTREPEYMPFSVNRSGMAMTYDAYRKRFEKIVKEMIPIYLRSDDPEIVIYGKILEDHPITPHIFRHYYTVQLVLSGISDVGELMSMRGDSSPESALTYLQNKGELEKQYSLVNNHSFDYLKFAAAARHKGANSD